MQNLGGKIRETWLEGVRVLRTHPLVFLPFLYLAVAEGLWLSICYYAPRPPVSLVLSPLIRAFMGEDFLHYPLNFLVLPRLLFIGRVMLYLTLGIIAFIMTMLSVQQVFDKQPVRFWGNFNHALRRYWPVFCSAIIYGLGALLVYKVPRLVLSWFFMKSAYLGIIHAVVVFFGFILLFVLESLLVYVPHYLVFGKLGVFRSIGRALALSRQVLPVTLLFVFCFRCLNIATIVLKNNISGIIDRLSPDFPELAMGILSADIVSFLVSNSVILVIATVLFLKTGRNNA
ncbi:MAG: hypothetical protein PHO30_05655 [Candidatus Omnitrophica bacterium]|nr:hypothetical protein [Candidatus Omnitrophota bacterium]